MRKVKRWRYYCEFCKKSGGSGGHMKRHEQGCTMNPKRVCGVCKMLEEVQQGINHLILQLPSPSDYIHEYHEPDIDVVSFVDELTVAANKALPGLREEANNCPACIMAAIRQAGIPVPMVTDFDFKADMEEVWSCINDANSHAYAL